MVLLGRLVTFSFAGYDPKVLPNVFDLVDVFEVAYNDVRSLHVAAGGISCVYWCATSFPEVAV